MGKSLVMLFVVAAANAVVDIGWEDWMMVMMLRLGWQSGRSPKSVARNWVLLSQSVYWAWRVLPQTAFHRSSMIRFGNDPRMAY